MVKIMFFLFKCVLGFSTVYSMWFKRFKGDNMELLLITLK